MAATSKLKVRHHHSTPLHPNNAEDQGIEVCLSSPFVMSAVATVLAAGIWQSISLYNNDMMTTSEKTIEMGCWIFAHAVGTLGALLPLVILGLWCFLNVEVVPLKVAELCSVYVFWNIHLVTYASWVFLFFLANASQGLSHRSAVQQYFVFVVCVPSPIVISMGTFKIISYRMGMGWGRAQQALVSTISTFFTCGAIFIQYFLEPTGLPILLSFTVFFGIYAANTFPSSPEITGDRLWPQFVGHKAAQRAIELIRGFLDFSVVYEDRSAVDSVLSEKKLGSMIGFHPHGIIPYTAALLAVTEDWQSPLHYMVDAFLHTIPVLKDVVQWMGCLEVSKEGLAKRLDNKACTMLVPGGQAEMLTSKSWDGKLVLHKTHRGFVRMALKHNTALIPALSMGEWHIMDNVYWPKTQAVSRKYLGFPCPLIPYGSFLVTPRRSSVTVIIGKPICPQDTDSSNISEAQVETIHQQYFDSLEKMFEKYKVECGYEDTTLEVVDLSDEPGRVKSR